MQMFDDKLRTLPGAARAIAASCCLGALAALCVVGEAASLARAVSALWSGVDLDSQTGPIALFACFLIARQLLSFCRDGLIDRFARRSCADLRARAMARLYELGPAHVAERGSGATTTTLVEGLAQVRNYIALVLPKAADLVAVPAVLGIALLVADPLSGVICILLVPCTVFFMRLLGSYAKENAARQFEAYRRMSNQFADTLAGLSTLEYLGAGKRHGKRVFETSERLRAATVQTLKTATLSSLVLDLIRVFALAAVAIMLGFRLMAGSVELASALAVLVIVPEFFAAIRRYASDFHASLDGREQLAAILEIADAPVKGDAPKYPRAASGAGADTGTQAAVELEARGVAFSYPNGEPGPAGRTRASGRPTASGKGTGLRPALAGVSFSVAAPMKVGIVGASGSGKSTLARLVAGFASPDAGSFAVCGAEGQTLCAPSWRERVAFIPQDPHIFSASLRDNVAFYHPQADDRAVAEALRRAGLGTLAGELPEGLDTTLGQGGRQLSGGQAQRVALARACLDAGRDVLVFDEPTAHLDLETELSLKPDMLALMEGCLVFFATHRLHWMREMDLVLVLQDGHLVESGAPSELLAAGGPLAELSRALRGGAL